MTISSSDITLWLGAYLWPFFRIGAMLVVVPVFGNQMLPMRIRMALALALTFVVVPIVPATPGVDVFSAQAVLVIINQLLIGVVMGFVFSLVFAAFIYGGQLIAMQMGLGFASLIDPGNGVQVPVISQFYVLMVTLLFLSMNGHLQLIQVLVESFQLLPVSAQGVGQHGIGELLQWSGHLFASAVMIALPVLASLFVINIAFGVMARSAPQLNIFAVGFPVTMTVGFILMWISLPLIVPQLTGLLNGAHGLSLRILGAGG